MGPEATWEPHEKHGQLTMQSDLPNSVFAFPKQRKEPMTDASHVRKAPSRRAEKLRRQSGEDEAQIRLAKERSAQRRGNEKAQAQVVKASADCVTRVC